MPTKLNHAGNQQNYVPAGNGDASGEYGDNANGSNIHFKVFEKPKSQVNEEKIKEIKSKIDELVNNNGGIAQFGNLLSDNNITGDLYTELGDYFMDKRKEKREREEAEKKKQEDEWYYKKDGKYTGISRTKENGYMTKEEYNQQTIDEYTKINKKVKEKNKAIIDDFKNKTNYGGVIGLSNLKDDEAKIVLDTATDVFNDFPELKNTLKGFGTKIGIRDRVKSDLFEKTDGLKNLSSIEDYRNRDFYNQHGLLVNDLDYQLNKDDNINYANTRSSASTTAFFAYHTYGDNTGSIILKPEAFAHLNDGARPLENGRWTISAGTRGTMAHELGHAVDRLIGLNSAPRGVEETKERILFWDEVLDHDIEKELSEYAKTNRAELVAEAFSSHYMGENNPLAEKIYNFAVKLYNRRFGKKEG